MSFLSKLHEAEARLAAQNADPWHMRLERVRGTIGDDGIERISTQTLFDHLEVLQRSRGTGASRRLAKVMRELGWTPVRVRDLTRGGYKEQVRGYCRDRPSALRQVR
jgi:hypothetical protein